MFAEKVENARSMALGPQGTVFVGSQYVGKVPDGSILISDDRGGRLIRVSYRR